jgi:hypothetical protein
MRVARVVEEMYRIENVIYVRIKAIADRRSIACPTARLLSYRPRARPSTKVESDALRLEPTSPSEPVHG